MKQAAFTITKDRLEAMSGSEKAEYLEHILGDIGDAEMVSFIVSVFSEEDLNSEEIEINVGEL